MIIVTRIVQIIALILLSSLFVKAQIDAESATGRSKSEPLPKSILETMAKQRIQDEKKEHDSLIENGEKAVELTRQIQMSFTKNKKLTSQDKSKLRDLEKLLKKMRSDLGGEGASDEELAKEHNSLSGALSTLLASTEKLFDEIKKTSRHTISAVAITSSNALLSIVKFLRFGK